MLLPLLVSAALAGGSGQTGKWEVQFSPQTSTCGNGTAPAMPTARWQVKVDDGVATVTTSAGDLVGWSRGSEISVTREVDAFGHPVIFRTSDWIGLVFTGDSAVGSLRQLRLAAGTQVMCFSDWKVSAHLVGLELTVLPADKRLDGVGCAVTLTPDGPQVMATSGSVWWVGLDGRTIAFVEAGDTLTAPDGENQWWLKFESPNPSLVAGIAAGLRDSGGRQVDADSIVVVRLWSARDPDAQSFTVFETCGD